MKHSGALYLIVQISHRKKIMHFLIVACLTTILGSGCRREIEVEVSQPYHGSIEESFTESAKTRLANTYPITMPVTARISRINLEPGDGIVTSQQLAEIDLIPFEQKVIEDKASIAALAAQMAVTDDNSLENSALAELNSTLKAMEELVKAAALQVEAEEARNSHAQKDLERALKLVETHAVSEKEIDNSQLHADTSLIELRKEQFNYAASSALLAATAVGPRAVKEYMDREQLEKRVTEHQLAEAQARLSRAEHELNLASLKSPINGIVLERYQQGDSLLTAGTRLLLLGNLEKLEVIADVLTEDAVQLDLGSLVVFRRASSFQTFTGKVKRIEPAGFTKLSSLGIEQQRVNVIISLNEHPEKLGVGFRLQARFLTGIKNNALIVDRGSIMQHTDRSYYVWKIKNNILLKQTVKLGLKSDLKLEVVDGLTNHDHIVKHPTTMMAEGMRVSVLKN